MFRVIERRIVARDWVAVGERRLRCGRSKSAVQLKGVNDIWDFIHFNCPLSALEARVLVGRYVLRKGERELAEELGVHWRTLNRAAWRLKAKLRTYVRHLPALMGVE